MNRILSAEWHVVVSYDIACDRRRNRICRELKDYGEHIQLSVFECLLRDGDLERLSKRLAELIDNSTDSVRIYRLCEACRRRVQIIGTGKVTEDPDVFVV